jgi:hypothetical protein
VAADVSTERGAETAPPARANLGRSLPAGRSTLRRVAVVVGLILLPLGAIVLWSAPLLHANGWTGAALVVGGASVLTTGIGLVAASAHAEHLRSSREERRSALRGRRQR